METIENILSAGCGVVGVLWVVLAGAALLAFLGSFLLSRLPGPKRTVEVNIRCPLENVWEVITDTGNFSHFIPGAWYWGPFDRDAAGPGTRFKKGHILDKKVRQWDYYIVKWEPHRRFSIGPKRTRWDFDFQLAPVDDTRTQLRCTRRFNALGFLPFSRVLMERMAVNAAKLAELELDEG